MRAYQKRANNMEAWTDNKRRYMETSRCLVCGKPSLFDTCSDCGTWAAVVAFFLTGPKQGKAWRGAKR